MLSAVVALCAITVTSAFLACVVPRRRGCGPLLPSSWL